MILDEATSAMDVVTDQKMTSLVQSEFSSCTVLTIAHRLHTIMDCDRILGEVMLTSLGFNFHISVVSEGSVAQFDQPYSLVREEAGILAQLVNEAGPAARYRRGEMPVQGLLPCIFSCQ